MTYEDIFKSTEFSLKECFFIIVLLLTELGLRCCAGFSPVAVRGGYSLVDVRGLLVAGASLVASMGPRSSASVAAARGRRRGGSQAIEHRLNSCGAWA